MHPQPDQVAEQWADLLAVHWILDLKDGAEGNYPQFLLPQRHEQLLLLLQ